MKNKISVILIIILFVGQSSLASGYEVVQKNESEKRYVFYAIKKDDKEIAKFCLIDSKKGFKFFSTESDSIFFAKNEKDFFTFSSKKRVGSPKCAILADFNYKVTIPKKAWSFGYFFNSLGILVYPNTPPYLKKVKILSPSQVSYRFFIETKIGDKDYYGLLVSDSLLEINEATDIIRKVKGLQQFKGNPTPILNFPIKLVSFEGRRSKVIYESHKDHQIYTCLFLSGKSKTVPK